MAIDNSSNEKQEVGESDAGLLIEIPYAYVSENLGLSLRLVVWQPPQTSHQEKGFSG